MNVFVAALAAALLAGCASVPEPVGKATQGDSGMALPSERDGSGEFSVYSDWAVSSCATRSEAGHALNWEHVTLHRTEQDQSVAIHFDWAPVNPTTQWLRFRIVEQEQMGGPGLVEWNGASPQDLLLVGDELGRMPETFHVQVSATGCAPESPVGVHVVPENQAQPVAWAVAWNTQTDL